MEPEVRNSVSFLAAHLVDSRHFLVTRLERPLPNPLGRYLADVRSIDEISESPPLEEIRTAWTAISNHLQEVLGNLTPEELAQTNAYRFPLGDSTRLGLIGFLVQHDFYHLGQIAFLRR